MRADSGSIDTTDNGDDGDKGASEEPPQINVAGVLAALRAFGAVEETWLSPAVAEHKNACEVLHLARLRVFEQDWAAASSLVSSALTPYNLEFSKPLYVGCVQELELIRGHSAYMIAITALTSALQSCGLVGAVGSVDTTDLDLLSLQSAYEAAKETGCTHKEVERLSRAAEVVFQVRKAVILGNWINTDHTAAYLHLLGRNFHQQPTFEDRALVQQLTLESSVSAGGGVVGGNASETVENIFHVWETKGLSAVEELGLSQLLGSGSAAAAAELDLAQSEMKYRRVVSELIKTIHSPGVSGAPGRVDTSNVATRTLEKTLRFAARFPEQCERGECSSLLRDAKLLLSARRLRLSRTGLA